jgi:hypothetical protein
MVVDHVMGIKEKINTSIHHVKVHGHWLREHCKQQLQIKWIPTHEMPADGLTKSLETQAHKTFINQIGLKQIKLT